MTDGGDDISSEGENTMREYEKREITRPVQRSDAMKGAGSGSAPKDGGKYPQQSDAREEAGEAL